VVDMMSSSPPVGIGSEVQHRLSQVGDIKDEF